MKTKGFKKAICLLLCMCAVSSLLVCSADEFAWNRLSDEWEKTKIPDAYVMSLQENDDQWIDVDRGVKLLRPAISENWTIETKISYNGLPEGADHQVGLVIYRDAENWLLWGQIRNATMDAGGVLNHDGIGLISISAKYDSLKITKSGRQYTFYYGTNGGNWEQAGQFTDVNGSLDGARYGFMGKSYMKPIMSPNVTDSYFVQFDYFLEDS